MRPFYTIDDEGYECNTIDDYNRYSANPELYEELSERGEKLVDEAFKKYMGSFYNREPLPLFKELKEEYDHRLEKKAKFIEINVPQIIIENEDRLITELHFKMKNKKFATLNDTAQSKYRAEYNKRKDSFYKSSEYIDLRKEIYSYNIARFDEIWKPVQD
jgi:uncharacterized protein YozE (UPF0346 family)